MHKKGGMLMGNGGDNGNGSAGTFFEGVMTVGYPTEEAIAAVQKNIARAGYGAYPLSLSRITTFTPGGSTQVGVFFENTLDKPVKGLSIQASLPEGWTISEGESLPESIAPGERVTAMFTLTAPEGRSAGWADFSAAWKGGALAIGSRIRSAEAVKVNELALAGEGLDPFVELYNAGSAEADLSGLELVVRRSGQASVRALTLPEGTRLAAGGFLLLKQAPEAVPAPTTLFIPVSTGPILSFPAGTDVLPATSVDGIAAGQKLGIGLGGAYELVTVTEVGTPATQTNLAKPAKAGDNTLFLDTSADLVPGQELTVDTGDRKETAVVKQVLVYPVQERASASPPPPATPTKAATRCSRSPLSRKGCMLLVSLISAYPIGMRSPRPPAPSPWSIPPPASSWTPSCTVRSRATPAPTGRSPAPSWRRWRVTSKAEAASRSCPGRCRPSSWPGCPRAPFRRRYALSAGPTETMPMRFAPTSARRPLPRRERRIRISARGVLRYRLPVRPG